MATVNITITGKQSSRVKVEHDPGNKKGLRSTLNTSWSKAEWTAMLQDHETAEVVAKSIGVTTEDLQAGIKDMQEQTKHHGPAVYRAACGYEIYDQRDGTRKPSKIPAIILGWDGDDRAGGEDLRVDRKPREVCQTCPKMKTNGRCFMTRDDYPGEVKDPLFTQVFYECRTFDLVPGAVPPPETEQGKGKGEQSGG